MVNLSLTSDLICNGGINPFVTPLSQVIIKAAAGSTITAEWHHTLAGAVAGDTADPIDASHHGPIITYLSVVLLSTVSIRAGVEFRFPQRQGRQCFDNDCHRAQVVQDRPRWCVFASFHHEGS